MAPDLRVSNTEKMSHMQRALFALLLFAVISHALGSVHAATHVTADLGECALCATYTNSSAALADTESIATPVARSCEYIDVSQPVCTVSPILCNHQRGPPPLEPG